MQNWALRAKLDVVRLQIRALAFHTFSMKQQARLEPPVHVVAYAPGFGFCEPEQSGRWRSQEALLLFQGPGPETERYDYDPGLGVQQSLTSGFDYHQSLGGFIFSKP